MTDTDSRYVSMDERSTGEFADSSQASSGSAAQWVSSNRRKVIAITVVASVLVLAALGIGYFLIGKEDDMPASSSSTGGAMYPMSSSSSGGMYPMSSSTGGGGGGSNGTVHPACNGLYEWACADWKNRTTPPANRTSFSRFAEIDVLNNAVLDDILKSGNTGYPLLDNLYASCMNTTTIDQLGVSPAQPQLDRLMAVQDWPAFMHLMGEWRTLLGMTIIVAPSVTSIAPSYLNTLARVSLTLNQAPLLLSNRNQYGNATTVATLQAAIERMFRAAGDNATTATANAMAVIDLEKQLNQVMPNSSQPMQLSSADQLWSYTNVHFDSYLAGAQIPLSDVPQSLFAVSFPAAAFYRVLNSSWMTTAGPSSAWKQYARYKMLNAAAPYLSQNIFSAFDYANYPVREVDPDVVAIAQVKVAVEKETLSADDARYLVCRRLANMADIGSDLLGHAFMDRQFNSTAYALVESMIADINAAWTTWLPSIDWLDNDGRVAMQQKMSNMSTHIGGPPLLASYGNVTNSAPDTFFVNVVTLRALHAVDLWQSITKPFDRLRLWNGSPASTVNAYYYSQYNSYYLYAGFFQAPLFFYNDYTANAPWTGEVIGHEAGHGFDANGINYNQFGVRNASWLAPQVMSTFRQRTNCTMASYSRLQYEGIYVDGVKTIGENMADIIGIRLSYLSYQAWAAKQTKAPTVPESFVPHVDTPEQYLMARWAQTECTIQTEQALKNQILNDVHAPGFARIDGAAQLFRPMAEAFNCPVGSYMHPEADKACFIY